MSILFIRYYPKALSVKSRRMHGSTPGAESNSVLKTHPTRHSRKTSYRDCRGRLHRRGSNSISTASGIRFTFQAGRVMQLTDWTPNDVEDGDAAFPDLTFLQLLCGRCRTEEVTARFVDCWTNGTTPAVLLDCLFPAFTSEVWHL